MLDIPVSLTVNFYWKLSQRYLVSIIVLVDVVSCKMDPLMLTKQFSVWKADGWSWNKMATKFTGEKRKTTT